MIAMIGAAVAAEVFKALRRPATWLIVGLWMVLSILFGYVFTYLSYRDASGARALLLLEPGLPGGLVGSAVAGFPMFAGALALILGVLSTGSEYSWDTVKMLLTARPRRWQILGAKVISLVGIMAGIVVLTFAVDAAASAILAAATGHTTPWPAAADLVRGIAGGLLVVTMWCLAGAMLGILLRGTSLAVGLGLVWALALENLIRAVGSVYSPLETVSRYLPQTNAGALVNALGSAPQGSTNGTPGVVDLVGGTHATVVVAAYVVAVIVTAALVLGRRDVSG